MCMKAKLQNSEVIMSGHICIACQSIVQACVVMTPSNVPFNHTILPMCTNTTKQLLLVACFKMISKSVGHKDAVVTVNVLDMETVVLGKQFKIFFGLKGRLNCCFFLTMHMQES